MYFQTDVIILSCDLVTDVDLHQVLNIYRNNNASLVSLYFSPSQDEQCIFTVPGLKSKIKFGKVIILNNNIKCLVTPHKNYINHIMFANLLIIINSYFIFLQRFNRFCVNINTQIANLQFNLNILKL